MRRRGAKETGHIKLARKDHQPLSFSITASPAQRPLRELRCSSSLLESMREIDL